MGTRVKFLGWVPYQGLGTPLFLRPIREGKVVGHPRGTGTSEPQQRLRAEETIHQSGVPLGKGTGVFWRAGRPPEWNAPTRRAAVNSGNSQAPCGAAAIGTTPPE